MLSSASIPNPLQIKQICIPYICMHAFIYVNITCENTRKIGGDYTILSFWYQ